VQQIPVAAELRGLIDRGLLPKQRFAMGGIGAIGAPKTGVRNAIDRHGACYGGFLQIHTQPGCQLIDKARVMSEKFPV